MSDDAKAQKRRRMRLNSPAKVAREASNVAYDLRDGHIDAPTAGALLEALRLALAALEMERGR